jgi:hypothetical protein
MYTKADPIILKYSVTIYSVEDFEIPLMTFPYEDITTAVIEFPDDRKNPEVQ